MSTAIDDDLWSAVGDPTRRRMLDLLLADGRGAATSVASPNDRPLKGRAHPETEEGKRDGGHPAPVAPRLVETGKGRPVPSDVRVSTWR